MWPKTERLTQAGIHLDNFKVQGEACLKRISHPPRESQESKVHHLDHIGVCVEVRAFGSSRVLGKGLVLASLGCAGVKHHRRKIEGGDGCRKV